MKLRQSVTVGEERFRVRPWHADPTRAYMGLTPEVARPSRAGIEDCLRRLSASGYTSVVTAALHPDEAGAFLACGFEEFDRLCVLSHDLTRLQGRTGTVPVRRGRRRNRRAALEVDAAAFPPLWQLDAVGFAEAIDATARSRFRVAGSTSGVVGYAVTGRAGQQAFLQRLATHPDHQGRGVATSLVRDALAWARRHRAGRALVNTQLDNERALGLYLRLGFEPTPTELLVLTRELP